MATDGLIDVDEESPEDFPVIPDLSLSSLVSISRITTSTLSRFISEQNVPVQNPHEPARRPTYAPPIPLQDALLYLENRRNLFPHDIDSAYDDMRKCINIHPSAIVGSHAIQASSLDSLLPGRFVYRYIINRLFCILEEAYNHVRCLPVDWSSLDLSDNRYLSSKARYYIDGGSQCIDNSRHTAILLPLHSGDDTQGHSTLAVLYRSFTSYPCIKIFYYDSMNESPSSLLKNKNL